jgi:hypothetical protein
LRKEFSNVLEMLVAALSSQPWHHVSMRALTIALCLLVTPALADVAGVASVKHEALSAYAGHIMGIVS